MGWSVEGSVEIVRGPVRKAVHGPAPWGGPWTGGQPNLVHRFKELWTNELMPTFKKDLLTELKTEIGKRSVQNADCRLQTADRVQNAD